MFQKEESENISLIPTTKKELCKPATPTDCVTLALNIISQIEFIDKPVHSLVLEVEVRNIDYTSIYMAIEGLSCI
jgi:hypothetical protein